MDYQLIALSKEDREQIYRWRNMEHIRMNMYNHQRIPHDDHCRWFEDILKEQMEYYRLFIYQEKPLGLVSFKKCSQQMLTCVWGFYIGEIHAPKGAGTIMGYLGLEYAFHTLGMKKIIAEVLSNNNKSEGLHRKLGFKHDNRLEDTFIREGQSIDVNSFSIIREDWEKYKGTLKMNFTAEA
ncbi:UDP-4-amino-4,6-dideoxy-N-acetyl-beta-L-altrosamine N-acetyltransferase [Peribacillus sp. NPDC097675]|uniref:UDP-4-amino-4, 6-dideoxy-N-acetyl-beta-L-altrosamine N-acetyltransferase n=1 Tax=Peribacillus sp. NPDC097675 TaxID=3390618 RepID=UPI003D05078E